jgi:protein transport protein SEC61 subunit alpha
MGKSEDSGFRILPYLRPVVGFLPEVEKPTKVIPLRDKLIWTLLALLIFLVSSQIPLYGITKVVGDDPMFWSRMILASNRGTLMELGIGPIVTAGMIMQLLVGSKIIAVDNSNKDDKELSNAAQKVLAIVIALFEAIAYVFSGMYGDVESIGTIKALMIILQLVAASIMVSLLDDTLNNGYGMVSAISLFIATNVCEELLWKSFSPLFENGEYEGAFVALFHFIGTVPNKFTALRKSFYRDTAPNLNNVLATVFVFLVVNYFQGFQVNIAIHNKQQRGHSESYPIKLFYTSNMPIILQSTLLSNLFFVSRLLYNRFPNFLPVRLLGKWRETSYGGQSMPVSGLVYYISPPNSVLNMINDPLHAVTYILFILVSCAVFSRTWIEVSGSSAKDVARNLKDQNITAYGGTEKLLYKKLNKYIPIAAYFGGVCIGILSLIADFLGAIGSGTGILLTCGIIYEFYAEFMKETRSGQSVF